MTAYSRANLSAISDPKNLATLGVRTPVRSGEGVLRALVDADGRVFAVLIPTGSAKSDQVLADAIAAAINAGCADPAPELANRFDPHHEAATRAESRQQAARMNSHRLPDAAE